MNESVENFYDNLAADYHLIYANWDFAIERQSAILERVIINDFDGNPDVSTVSMLDCSCGIGTQAIGLSRRGYTVTGTDISNSSIIRARHEAHVRGVSIAFSVADMRSLDKDVDGQFDVVLSADNALPHLLSDHDILLACQNMFSKLRQGGILVLSLRDYDSLLMDKPRTTQPNVFNDGKRITFQTWEWSNHSNTYKVVQFIISDVDGKWETKTFVTTYRALLRGELDSFLKSSGFQEVIWHMPEDTGFHQPIVTAKRHH